MSEEPYGLPTCIAIAAAPLGLAVLIAWFAEPRGAILLDVRPTGWLVDYLIIWPIVIIASDILLAGRWLWIDQSGRIDVRSALRLSGGFLLIYDLVWLCVVPVVHEAAVRYPFLPIDPPSYSQIFRFLSGVVIGVAIVVFRRLRQLRRNEG